MRVVDTGVDLAQSIMEWDANFLDQLEGDGAILHLYEWKGPSATYGHFIDPAQYLNIESVCKESVSLARRPTGGGIVFHLTDLAFSVLLPATHPKFSHNSLSNYALINQGVLSAISSVVGPQCQLKLLPFEPSGLDLASARFCMAKPTKYDVLWQGRKIGGAAQRRTKKGFLHQGTISIAPLSENFLKMLLLPKTRVLEAMQQNSAYLLNKDWTAQDLLLMRQKLKEALVDSLNF